MGSVPNCRKEIADHYPIRWFKCKLKPPKNWVFAYFFENRTVSEESHAFRSEAWIGHFVSVENFQLHILMQDYVKVVQF